jgi:micrococcal nuclease
VSKAALAVASGLVPDESFFAMKTKFLKSKWIFYLVFILAAGLLVLLFYPRDEGWRVERIIDGDTIVLSNGEEIRYIGIDTPEKSDPYFEEAKELNRKMVEGKRVSLEYDQEKKDVYFRTLAYVRMENVLVNAELVRQGLACVYSRRPNLKYADYLCSVQSQAREAKIGLWSIPIGEKEDHYLGNKHSFRFHRPGCKYALQMADKNKIVFKTRDEALDSCYSPCRTCKP